MAQPESRPEVYLERVPARLFLESQDHQHDLIRELMLIDLGDRFDLTQFQVSRRLARLISEILERYADVRWATRQQALKAIDEGQEFTRLAVPVRPGIADALRRWLQLTEEANRFCEEGALLTLAARPEVRELRRWYVREIVKRLPPDMR